MILVFLMQELRRRDVVWDAMVHWSLDGRRLLWNSSNKIARYSLPTNYSRCTVCGAQSLEGPGLSDLRSIEVCDICFSMFDISSEREGEREWAGLLDISHTGLYARKVKVFPQPPTIRRLMIPLDWSIWSTSKPRSPRNLHCKVYVKNYIMTHYMICSYNSPTRIVDTSN